MRASVLLALGALQCSAGTSDPGESPAVDLESIIGGVPASAYPEAAFLNIDMSGGSGYACSAALIAPRVILTAGHCVDGHSRWDVYVGTAYRQSTHGVTYDWAESGNTSVNPKHHDIGLVFLDVPISLASYPTLSTTKLANGTSATDVGRVLDGTMTARLYAASVTLMSAESIGYLYDYQSPDVIEPGDSGGPVFVSGSHTIAAVNSGAGGGIQVLARVDLLASWISSQINAHGGPGATAPSLPQDAGAGGAGGSLVGAGGSSLGVGGGGGQGGGAGAAVRGRAEVWREPGAADSGLEEASLGPGGAQLVEGEVPREPAAPQVVAAEGWLELAAVSWDRGGIPWEQAVAWQEPVVAQELAVRLSGLAAAHSVPVGKRTLGISGPAARRRPNPTIRPDRRILSARRFAASWLRPPMWTGFGTTRGPASTRSR